MGEDFTQLHRDLNQKYPRFSDLQPKDFQRLSVDAEANRVMQSAQNQRNFYNNRLMVPSDAELKYRSNNPALGPDSYSPANQPKPVNQPPSGGRGGPSSATPPPTPRTTPGATALNAVEAPPTAAPRTPPTTPNSAPGARPSGIPQPAGVGPRPGLSPGAAAAGGVGAAGAAAIGNLAAGMPLGPALGGAAAVGAGTVVGGALGSAFGPAGTVIGGYLGGALAGAAFNHFFPPPAQPQPEPVLSPPPFTGGQNPVRYQVRSRVRGTRYAPPHESIAEDVSILVQGPIQALTLLPQGLIGPPNGNGCLYVRGTGPSYAIGNTLVTGAEDGLFGVLNGGPASGLEFLIVTREDGQPDTGGNPPSPPLLPDSRPPTIINQYINQSAPPRGTPAAGSNPAPQNYAPASGTPANATPKTGTPGPNLSPFTQTQAPGFSPTGTPTSTGAPNNSANTNPAPNNPITVSPDGKVTFTTPGHASQAQPWQFPAQQALPAAGNATGFSPTSTPDKQPAPSGMPQTANPQQPGVQPSTPPATAPTTQPQTTPNLEKEFEELKKGMQDQFDKMLIGLVGATQILQGINNNTAPAAIEKAAAAGTCRTTQPGGCTSNLVNNAASNSNKSMQDWLRANGLDVLGLGADGLLMTKLNLMDNKLGSQIAGGLSGGIGRMSKFLGIDRVLNLLNTLAILHNAMMLSASLKITLLEMLSSIGNATGLLQTSEGDNVDLNQVFNNGIEGLITHLIGAENFASLKLSWRKYSSIYRAATNSLNAITSMFNSLGEAISTTAEYTGKIGNALRAAGAVSENAYNFFSEKVNVRTSRFMRFQTRTAGVGEILEAVNEVAENVIEGQEQFKEYEENKKKFDTELAAAQKNPGIDNTAIKEEAAKIKENLAKDPSGEDDEGLLSFLTDN